MASPRLANSRRKGYLARGDRFQLTSSELALKGNAGNLEEIDLTNIKEVDDETDLAGELACAGGACEIT